MYTRWQDLKVWSRPQWGKKKMILRVDPSEANRKSGHETLQTKCPRGGTEVRPKWDLLHSKSTHQTTASLLVPTTRVHPRLSEHSPNSLAGIHCTPPPPPPATGSAPAPPTSIAPPLPKNDPCLPPRALAPPSADVLLWRFPVLKVLLNPVYSNLYSLKHSKCLWENQLAKEKNL